MTARSALPQRHSVRIDTFSTRALATAVAIAMGISASGAFAVTVTQTGANGASQTNPMLVGGPGGSANAASSDSIDPNNTATAYGGNGGNGPAGGGSGGRALAYASSKVTGNTAVTINVVSQGGNGGNGIGANSNGGHGGNAAFINARGQSGSGSVTANATLRGGNGGNATGNGSGGNGGITTSYDNWAKDIDDLAVGVTTGPVSLTQTVYGGNAGSVENGAMGTAGVARSYSTGLGSYQASQVNAATSAYGGAGGNRNSATGVAGNGADTSASTRLSSSVASELNASATAHAGKGGIGSGGAANGKTGIGGAMATADNNMGAAKASAQSSGGTNIYGMGSSAYASAKGKTSSVADASIDGTGNIIRRAQLTAHAASDIGGKALAAVATGDNMNHSGSSDIFPVLNVASTTTVPGSADTGGLLYRAPAMAKNFNTRNLDAILGLVTLGGGVETAVADPGIHLFSSSLAMSLDMSNITQPQNLLLGLIDGKVYGSGFQSLHFRFDQEGVTIIDETFLSLAEANAFFNDRTLDLGAWASAISPDNVLDLAFFFDVTQFGTIAGGYKTNMIFGNSALVPVPGAAWLFGSAVMGLLGQRRWSRR